MHIRIISIAVSSLLLIGHICIFPPSLAPKPGAEPEGEELKGMEADGAASSPTRWADLDVHLRDGPSIFDMGNVYLGGFP